MTVAACMVCRKEYCAGCYASLPLRGPQDSGIPGVELELRNCGCGSTIAAAVRRGKYLDQQEYRQIEQNFDQQGDSK